jgi:hypothetical protein
MIFVVYDKNYGAGTYKDFTVFNTEFKAHNKLVSNGKTYKIEFYAPTWTYSNKQDANKAWNRACGKLRTKRYIHLNKRKSTMDKLRYIKTVISQEGCYLMEIEK